MAMNPRSFALAVTSAALIASACSGGGGSGAPSCPVATGGPTTHPSTLNSSETWTQAGSPHLLPNDTTITANAVITVEPCAEIRIAPQKTIGLVGALNADGTASQPITIRSTVAGQAFAGIKVSGAIRLHHVTIMEGGDPLNSLPIYPAALEIRGNQSLPVQPMLEAQFLTVTGSKSQGILLTGRGGFTANSSDVTITGSAGYPIHSWAESAGTIPPGIYTGNGHDEIFLPGTAGNEAVMHDATFHDRGVPYHLGNGQTGKTLNVAALGGGVATLTIEPGVVIRVTPTGIITIEPATGTNPARGALIAMGTPSKPIVFTSAAATPAAGDWESLFFGSRPDPNDRLNYVRVEYAGGATVSQGSSCNGRPWEAAIRMLGSPAPANEFISNSTVAYSGGHGIDRGWRDDVQPDFLATNTFTGIARCRQTQPSASTGACPSPVPCP
jgi:hypothetical protein